MKDPLDAIEHPTLADQVKPYQKYGDDELAVALLHFQKKFESGLPALNSNEATTFQARCRPADTGASYICEDCQEPVRGVAIPGRGVQICPLCSETPSMLELGRGLTPLEDRDDC